MTAFSIPWTQELALAVGDLDDSHQRLLLRVNELLNAVPSGNKIGVLLAFDELRVEAEQHFAEEEAQMAALQYPDAARHRESHQKLLYGLSRLQMTLNVSDQFGITAGPFMFLQSWFREHLTHDDRQLAEFVKGRQAKDEAGATDSPHRGG